MPRLRKCGMGPVLAVRSGVELRAVTEADAEPLFRTIDGQRPYLREFLPWVDGSITSVDTLEFIRRAVHDAEFGLKRTFVIWCGKARAGVIDAHAIDSLNHRAEIGYWLSQEFTGQGIMTDAVRALEAYLFDTLAMNRLEIRCATDNWPSQAIPRRLGYTQEGTLREAQLVNGRYLDLIVFSKLRRER
jgi:ribosomal-protein-serine acetyltransferase